MLSRWVQWRSLLHFTGFTRVCKLHQGKPNVRIPTLFEKTKYRFGLSELRYPYARLNASGENMFAICAEYPVFEDFVEHLHIPDTFQSWFSVTSLHMWLCLVRLRQEGVEGQLLKQRFINLLWLDLRSRMRTFKILLRQHAQVSVFRMQFFGAMFAYDEGLLSNSDPQLVASIWRNLFLSSPSVTGKELELALNYTRKQLAHLEKIPSSTILGFGSPTFLPLVGDKLNEGFANQRLQYCLSWPISMRNTTKPNINHNAPEKSTVTTFHSKEVEILKNS